MQYPLDPGAVSVAFLSGKGGTGKTTVAVNFSLMLAGLKKYRVQFLDCDVEEPNAHIFLKPHITERISSGIPVPAVDHKQCTFCGKCQQVCVYNAIAVLKDDVLVFHELCHGCGGCALLCPQQAISETQREIGIIEKGICGSIAFSHGRLNVGEPMASPLIRDVKKHAYNETAVGERYITVIDVPPGTSCPVLEAVKDSDFAVLVTEPTPFGLHDLKLAVETMRELSIPFGVVINRSMDNDRPVTEYCNREQIPILVRIPFDRRIAVAYSRGESMLYLQTGYRQIFHDLLDNILREKNGFLSMTPEKRE